MISIFDTESIIFNLLIDKTSVGSKVYVGDTRPLNDENEAITINTITLMSDALPMTGVSNINVYCPDIVTIVNGLKQKKSNRVRLREISKEVISIIRTATVDGILITPDTITTSYDYQFHQHYTNIRLNWLIQK